ncbi:hypothetical protein Tco_0811617, partial [Tanacetum coccineum]
KHYEADIEAMNLILNSIPNDIYNSVDACSTAKAMWQRVKRLMRRTVKNKVDRETRSYIPWASHFRRYLNLKRENRKWLNKAIDERLYEFRIFTPFKTEAPRMQKEEDLRGDNLKHYEAEIEAMNLILNSIPNDIYNSVDGCSTAKAM